LRLVMGDDINIQVQGAIPEVDDCPLGTASFQQLTGGPAIPPKSFDHPLKAPTSLDVVKESPRKKFMSRKYTTGGMQLVAQGAKIQSSIEKLEDNGVPLYELFKASRLVKTQSKVYEGLFFLIFMVLFALIYIELRKVSFAGESTEALLDLFLKEEFTQVNVPGLEDQEPFFQKTYDDIKTLEEFWLWVFGPLLNGLYFGPYGVNYTSNQQKFGLPMDTGQLYVLGSSTGGVLFRSFRILPGNCKAPDQVYQTASIGSPQCYGKWDPSHEQTDSFGPGTTGFTYTQNFGSSLEGTYLGELYFNRNQYGSGGYGVDLPTNNGGNQVFNTINSLFQGNWADVATRAISAEFQVFDPATNVLTACRFFTEFSQTGNVRPSYRFYHINAVMWKDLGGFYIFLSIVFLVLLVFFTFKWFARIFSATNLSRTILRWNVLFDSIVLVLFWVSISKLAYLASKEVMSVSSLQETLNNQGFTGGLFADAESYHSVDALVSIILMLATVRLISFLPFKTTKTIWATLTGSVKDIVILGLVIILFWAGFSTGAHLTFGNLGFEDFDRIDRTFGTLMVLMFSGDMDYNAMRDVSFMSAPIFYAVYMIFMWGVMLNLFVAIIVITYERFSDVQQNFDNWKKEHHGTERVCIIMTDPQKVYHKCRQAWLELKRRSYGSKFKDEVQGPMIELSERSKTPEISEASKLREQMQEVLRESISTRDESSRSLNHPFKQYFRKQVHRVMWAKEVEKTRRMIEEIDEKHAREGAFIKKWRREVDYAQERGTGHETLYIFFWNLCCRCCPKRAQQNDDESEASIDGEKLLSGPSSKSVGSSQSLTQEGLRRREQIQQYYLLNEVIRQERELCNAKSEIQKILSDTQKLFKKHRVSFNRLLRKAWNNTSDEERLEEIKLAEIKEMLSPGCVEERRKCKLCSQQEIDARAQKLITHYLFLKKRKAALAGKKKMRRPRIRRLTQIAH